MQALRKDLLSFSSERKFGILATIKDRLELLWLKRRPKTAQEKTAFVACSILAVVSIGLIGWICHLYWAAANSPANKISLDWQEPKTTVDVPEWQLKAALLKIPILQSQENPMTRVKELFNNDNIFLQAGQYQQAIDRFQKDYQLSLQVNGPEALYTTLIEESLAECYFRTGELMRAKELLEKVIKRAHMVPMSMKSLAHEMFIYGEIFHQQGSLLAAERAYKNSISLWSKPKEQFTFGEFEFSLRFPEQAPSDEFVMLIAKLADIELARKDYDDAERYYTQAIKYWDSTAKSASEDPGTNAKQQYLLDTLINDSIAHDRLAKAQIARSKKTDAVSSASESVRLMQKARGWSDPATGIVTRNYSDILWQAGNWPQSAIQQYKALSIFAKAE
jgi:tetratricopeptide (TPR) repeat protein